MTEEPKTTDTPRKPDGIITTQANNQTFVVELFFNHSSTETFRDKLLKMTLAEIPSLPIPSYTRLDGQEPEKVNILRQPRPDR